MNIQKGIQFCALWRFNCLRFSSITHRRQIRTRRIQRITSDSTPALSLSLEELSKLHNADDLNEPDPTIFSQDVDVKCSLAALRKWIDQMNIEKHFPILSDTRNLANLVPSNSCLQNLVQLGVDLSRIESIPGVANMLVKMDFQTSIAPKLWFLSDYGFQLSQLAHLITMFPKILKLTESEITSRFAYFSDRGFPRQDIIGFISNEPRILSLPSIEVDRTLGEIKFTFNFEAPAIRHIVTNACACILQPISLMKDVFVILTKMQGFSVPTTQRMVIQHPKLILASRRILSENFFQLAGRLDLSLDTIAQSPQALSSSPRILAERTNFLVLCDLFQPDGTKALFTPLDLIVDGTDEEFCQRFADSKLNLYNMYLKTL